MASRSVNKVILVGRLGKDAETKFTPSGTARTTFTVATNRRWKDQQTGDWKEETDWHNVVLWQGENISNYLTKGTQVYVEGRLQSRSYDDKDGNKRYITEVVTQASDLLLLSGRGEGGSMGGGGDEYDQQPRSAPRSFQQRQGGGAPSGPGSGRQQHAPEPDFEGGVTDDDVPF